MTWPEADRTSSPPSWDPPEPDMGKEEKTSTNGVTSNLPGRFTVKGEHTHPTHLGRKRYIFGIRCTSTEVTSGSDKRMGWR
eukprot:3967964-Amphidinium_carterae.1